MTLVGVLVGLLFIAVYNVDYFKTQLFRNELNLKPSVEWCYETLNGHMVNHVQEGSKGYVHKKVIVKSIGAVIVDPQFLCVSASKRDKDWVEVTITRQGILVTPDSTLYPFKPTTK